MTDADQSLIQPVDRAHVQALPDTTAADRAQWITAVRDSQRRIFVVRYLHVDELEALVNSLNRSTHHATHRIVSRRFLMENVKRALSYTGCCTAAKNAKVSSAITVTNACGCRR